ncbi:MAG: uracil phosphoribosyltransferase [Verrucomicrobia bacterium]|nr:uracil phosphoribosyltransferase [Verrucomicrobiota bacterium]
MTHPHLHVVDHPLIQAKLTTLRSEDTPVEDFRRLLREIAALLAFAVTQDMATVPREIRTPLAPMTGCKMARPIVLVPILRAGLGLLEGMLHLFPRATVGHIGMYRDETTLLPQHYYAKTPPNLAEGEVVLIDPMLATGQSAAAAVSELKNRGASHIRLLCLVAAPEGVEAMRTAHPEVPIYVAAVDAGLNERGYIVPGLGDAGDRFFGT